MTDTLFPDTWSHIDIGCYVEQYRIHFDEIDLLEVSYYRLIQKIKIRGLVLSFLANDPLKEKRQQLNNAISGEIRRQVALLTREYNSRIESGLTGEDNPGKTFLSKYIPLVEEYKPPAQVIGMKTLEIKAARGIDVT